jgi:acetyl esterase/lipase
MILTVGCSPSKISSNEEQSLDPGAFDGGSNDSDADETGNLEAPTVMADSTYTVEVSTHTYAQGLVHDDWAGEAIGTHDLILDVYEPVDAPEGRPVAFIIHGGGFVGGSRTNMNSSRFARYFAERGFVAVSIDYRVAGHRGTVPAEWLDYINSQDLSSDNRDQGMAMYPAARDAKAALRWLHTQAETYSIDTDFITTIGGSAGSYLAVMLGVTDAADFRDELTVEEDPTLATTNLDAEANVHTIIDHWGGISHMLILEALDGRSRFDATDAPLSIVHGTEDRAVPFVQAEMLRDAYTETGVDFDFHPIEGGGHGIWGEIINGLTLEELALDFVVLHQGLLLQAP